MVDFGGLGRKAGEFLQSEKAQKALKSEKVEKISDDLLQKGGALASRLTKGKYDDRIEDFTRRADGAVGTDDTEHRGDTTRPEGTDSGAATDRGRDAGQDPTPRP